MKKECFSQQPERLPDSIRAGETVEPFISRDNEQSTVPEDSARSNANQNEQEKEDSIVFREVPDSVVKMMKSDKAFAYANNPAYWKNVNPDEQNNLVLRFLKGIRKNPWIVRSLYVFFGAIILVVLYMIVVRNKLFIFYSSSKLPRTGQNLIDSVDDPDFSVRIHKAIRANDFRNAVRYLYLKTLKIAGEKKLIRLNIQSTNQEYLTQLNLHPIKESFRLVTKVYEKACYGGFEIRQDQFIMIKQQFDQLFKTLAA